MVSRVVPSDSTSPEASRALRPTLPEKLLALEEAWRRLQTEWPALVTWNFGWDRARKRFGACHWGAVPRITLSVALVDLNPLEDALDTLRHEAAHALAGPRAGHGAAWRRWARRLGARPTRCHTAATVPGRWRLVCETCGWETRRHRRPRRGSRPACPRCCGGRWDPVYVLKLVAAP